MTRITNRYLFLALLGLLATFGVSATQSTKPEITTQGFSADVPQEGTIGNYPRLRVRIEAADRIEKLIIKERSYEVDLASTRDKYNLSLFGLEQTPRSYTDVTLNLQNYINERIDNEGRYELHLVVVDRSNNRVEKNIYLQVRLVKPEKEPSAARDIATLQTGAFIFQRIGTGPVDGAEAFGIDWKNIDDANVSIRMAHSDGDNSNIVVLDEADFDNMQTIDQLIEKVAGLKNSKAVILTTANNGAARKVFSIIHDDKHYIFRITSSSALPSENGTKVILKGDFKSGASIDQDQDIPAS